MRRTMHDLTTKTVLITGAKGGLGTYVTRASLDAGARVIGVSRSISAADFDDGRFVALPAELSSRESAEDVMRKAGRVDAVVHLMGGWAGGATVEDTNAATLDRMLDLNLKSAFFVMGAAARAMRAQAAGKLLAVGSRAAVEPLGGSAACNAAKAGLVSLMRTLAAELADARVTSNIVLPGTMDTPQNRAANAGRRPVAVGAAVKGGVIARLSRFRCRGGNFRSGHPHLRRGGLRWPNSL